MGIGARQYKPDLGSLGRGTKVRLDLRFTPNGSGAITLTDAQKREGLLSCTRTGTGAFTLILDQNYSQLCSWAVTVRTSSGWATGKIEGTVDLAASGGASIPIVLYAGTTDVAATDVAANAANEVSVQLVLSKSSVP